MLPGLMTDGSWLVVAGGLVAVVSGLVPLVVQRRWAREDRLRAADAQALPATVEVLTAWKDVALAIVSGDDPRKAHERALALDAKWEADLSLIPDREAANKLLDLAKSVQLTPRRHSEGDSAMITSSQLIALHERVLESARQKRRDLAWSRDCATNRRPHAQPRTHTSTSHSLGRLVVGSNPTAGAIPRTKWPEAATGVDVCPSRSPLRGPVSSGPRRQGADVVRDKPALSLTALTRPGRRAARPPGRSGRCDPSGRRRPWWTG